MSVLCFLLLTGEANAQLEYKGNKTLRVDYIFSGNSEKQEIALDELSVSEGWYGRRKNLDSVPLHGNGQLVMRDARTDSILYAISFSTLFQEWLGTEEATRVRRAFENVFLLPMPDALAKIQIELYDFKGKAIVSMIHEVNPSDILIRPIKKKSEYVYLRKSERMEGHPINIAIVAEGYTKKEIPQFYNDAEIAVEAILSHEPFRRNRDRFNFVAVGLVSEESGTSIPHRREWRNTALGSHFDTFYSDRYLTTLRIRQLHDALTGIPYEHIIILANTDNYGGGGIYNSYTLTAAHHSTFRPVVVHEFGHSFAGLADEYFYDDQYVEYYYPEIEPWEQNITTLKSFEKKWKDMLPANADIPTRKGQTPSIGVYEGGGYQSKGVWRACENCRMRTNEATDFCTVCQRAIERLIHFYSE